LFSEPPISPDGDTRPLTRTRAAPALFVLFLLAAVGALIMIVGGVLFLLSQPEQAAPITVYLRVEGRTYTVSTTASTVRDLLHEQRITLQENSVVAPDLNTRLMPEMSIALSAERSVTVTIDGETSIFRTVFDHPLDILESVGFIPDEGDLVRVNGTRIEVANLTDYPLPAQEIIAQSAVSISITADGEVRQIQTTATTVGDALAEAGITLYLGDQVFPDVTAPITVNLQIVIERSRPVTITVDDTMVETRVVGQTVGDALAAAEIVLSGLDYAVPPENTRLSPGMSVRVVRVTEQIETEQLPVPFEVVYQADAELPLDQQQVIQAGIHGVEQRNTRVRYEDGVEVSRVDEGTSITQQPVSQIIAYGTKVVALGTIDTPEGPREYWRKLRVYATSYHPAALGGDDVTATGRKLQKGIVGIDPKLIPYDTNLYVEGYGTGVAADTGGPRSSRYWIDLGYSDSDYVPWSRRVDVYLLMPVPEKIPYILPPR
jgi:resuscitation-promoting factor RpfB